MNEGGWQRSEELTRLRWSLQALARAGSNQRSLFPGEVTEPNRLALEFDQCASVIRTHDESELSAVQAESLAAIDRKLATISRDGAEFDAEVWTEAALSSSEHWADVRRLAASALDAFGWALDTTVPAGAEQSD